MDRSLVCRECGVSFVFTQGEQEFYQSRGLANPPSRCPKCRAARRALQGPAVGAVASRPQDSRPMFPATCARCGQATQVPFQPRGDRPVYCSSCFHAARTSTTPIFSPAPRLSSAPEPPADEGRRERRPRKTDRWEREREKVPYSRRSNTFIADEGDDDV